MKRATVKCWIGVIASMFCSLLCGLSASFSVYAVPFKEKFVFNQVQMEMLASSATMAFSSALLGAVIIHKFGYTVCYITAAIMVTSANLLLSLSTTQVQFFRNHIELLCLFQFMSSSGGSLAQQCTTTISVRKFSSKHSGKLLGLHMGALSSGRFFYSAMYQLFFERGSNISQFFSTIPVPFVCIIAICVVCHTPDKETEADDSEEMTSLAQDYSEEMTSLTQDHSEEMTSLTQDHSEDMTSLTQDHFEKTTSLTQGHSEEMTSITLDHSEKMRSLTQNLSEEMTSLTLDRSEKMTSNTQHHWEEMTSLTPDHFEEMMPLTQNEDGGDGVVPAKHDKFYYTRCEILKSKFFLLYIVQTLLSQTSAFSLLNNITDMAKSVHFDQPLHTIYINTFLTVLSRIATGLLLDYGGQVMGDVLLFISYLTFSSGVLICLLDLNITTVYIMSGLTGIASGVVLNVVLGVLTSTFGSVHYPFIFGVVAVSISVSTAITQLFIGWSHDYTNQVMNSKEIFCKDCFHGALIILLVVSLMALLFHLLNLIFNRENRKNK